MEIVRQLEQTIAQEFSGSEIFIDYDKRSGKASGIMLWEGFGSADQVDRQTQLWSVLRSRLGADSTKVSTIFTYTPKEYKMLKAS